MTCLACEVRRAKLLAQVYMLGKPRYSEPAWLNVAEKLTAEFGASHYLTHVDGEYWLCRSHPVTFVEIKLVKVAHDG